MSTNIFTDVVESLRKCATVRVVVERWVAVGGDVAATCQSSNKTRLERRMRATRSAGLGE